MQYTLSNVQRKSADWLITDAKGLDGTMLQGASMNRTNKDGTVIQWPQWDTLSDGAVIEGNAWTNPTNQRQAIYPPKPPVKKSFGGAAITKAQEKKAEDIATAQGRKNEAIALAGAQRDAVLITVEIMKQTPFPTDQDIKDEIEKWMKYFLNLHNQPFI